MTRQPELLFALLVLVLACSVTLTRGFTAVSVSLSAPCQSRIALSKGGEGMNDDFPPPEDELTTSSIDWDAEWKKVVKQQKDGKKIERPGDGYYKSEAEIKAIKAANKAAQQAASVQASVTSSLPSWNMLKGDWKFWIGALAVISVGMSLLSASTMNAPPPVAGGESYYI